MKIHIFTSVSFPDGLASTNRIKCYAKGLINMDNSVEVHCTHRLFEKNGIEMADSSGSYEGIPYNYIAGKYKSQKKVKRGLDWFLLDDIKTFVYAFKTIKKNDIVYVYFYQLFLQLLLLFVVKSKGAVAVKETCEHPSALSNKKSFVQRFCNWYEYHVIMRLYDGFVPISSNLASFVERYKKKTAKSLLVPILVDDKKRIFSKTESPYKVPYIIHTGTMFEQKDSISNILHAFALYKSTYHTNVKLIFTGPHATEHCKYIPYIKELEIENDVELLGIVSQEKLDELQHFASLSIIYKSDNLQTRNCLPTKLGEMLISGVPVITTSIGDSKKYLTNGESVLLFDPGDEKELINHIHSLLSNKEYASKIAIRGKAVAEKHFNPMFQGKRLHNFLIELLSHETSIHFT